MRVLASLCGKQIRRPFEVPAFAGVLFRPETACWCSWADDAVQSRRRKLTAQATDEARQILMASAFSFHSLLQLAVEHMHQPVCHVDETGIVSDHQDRRASLVQLAEHLHDRLAV